MQQSTECWGADAAKFRPERWLPDGIHKKYKHWLVVRIFVAILIMYILMYMTNSEYSLDSDTTAALVSI